MQAGKVISHFRITSRLGGGGMGVVYDAEDVDLKRPVALKFLPPHLSADDEANTRFIQEAQAASALNHPNVCTIHEIGRTDEQQLFIAMARYDGVTLKKKIAERAITLERAVSIAMQIADGLTAAHARGIVHRDIKPANVLLTEDDRAVILDFGLAKLVGRVDITSTGSMLGTAAYMSPEQIRGESIDARTDQWSLGVVLYEMLTGDRPFKGDYEQATAYAILNQPTHDLPPELPENVRAAISRALSKDPAERFATVAEFAAALGTVNLGPSTADSQPSASQSVSLLSRISHPKLLRPLIAGVGLAGIIVSLLVVTKDSHKTVTKTTDVRNAVAVLPFSVSGDDQLQYLSEGMVDMFSTVLDGIGGLRSIDPFAIISAVRKSGEQISDPEKALSLAKKYGASAFILGSVLRVGDGLRLSASLYEEEEGVVARAEEHISDENGISDGIDQLIRSLFAVRLRDEGATWQSLAASASQSTVALKAFLDGDRLFRQGQFKEAQDAYTLAVGEDSTFALAWLQLARVVSFTDDWAEGPRLDSIAMAHSLRLPDRERRLIQARNERWLGRTRAAEAIYTSVIESYPEEVHAWSDLAELQYHDASILGRSQLAASTTFGKALDLDPNNAEILFHSIELAIRGGRPDDARVLIELYPKEDIVRRKSFEYLLELARADSLAIDRLTDSVSAESPAIVNRVRSYSSTVTRDLTPYGLIARKRLARTDLSASERDGLTIRYSLALLAGRGKIGQADALLSRVSSGNIRDHVVFHRVIQAVSPPYSAAIIADLAALRETVVSDWPRNPGYLTTWKGREELVSSFLAALLSLRMGDEAGWRSYRLRVNEHLSHRDSLYAAGLANGLDAVRAASTGDHAGAIDFVQRVRIPFVLGEEVNWLKGRHLLKTVYATSLAASGDCARAAEFFAHLGELDSYSLVPAYFWEAECRDDLGEVDEAVRLYRRFVSLWKTADPPLIQMVVEAEARIERLLSAALQES